MNTTEYLDQAKAALNIESDYEFAKRLGVSKQAMSDYRNGKRSPDAYACTRLAIILGLDPARVIADLESQHEKNPARRDFWTGFLSRAALIVGLCCTLAWSSIDGTDSGWAVAGSSAVAASAVYFLCQRMRIIWTLCITVNFALWRPA